MTQPMQPQAAPDHARHDTALIAALADREPDVEPRDLARARELVAQCERCRDLLADLVIIRAAIPVTGTPARPRTFTLTAADAQRLGSTRWRRFVGFFGSARDGLSRPLAIGLTTIGIVALVVTASPISLGSFATSGSAGEVLSTIGNSVSGGAGGAAPQAAATAAPAPAEGSAEVTDLYASAAASAAASYAPAANQFPSAAPSASSDNGRNTVAGPYASGVESGRVFTGSNDTDNDTADADAEQQGSKSTDAEGGIGAGPSLGIVVGGLCLILGIALFALRWTSRRLAGG